MNDIFDRISKMDPNGPDAAKAGGVIALVIGITVVLFILASAFKVVSPGTVGVVTYFGAVQDKILPEGLHFVMPVKTKIIPIDVRIQRIKTEAIASSKDLQIVSSGVVLNYHVDKAKANTIFQEIGHDYRRTVVAPAIQEAVKSGTAQFNAEELITQRPKVKSAIFEDIRTRLSKYNIIVTDFSITDFAFSPEFNKAIEEKQVAEQRALRSKNDLNRIKTEAEQALARGKGEADARLINARAEAESQRLLKKTLNQQLVDLRAIEKWDGKLPQYVGSGTVPFINIK